MPTSHGELAEVRFAVQYQLHRTHDLGRTWLRLQWGSEVLFDKSLEVAEASVNGMPLRVGLHEFTQDFDVGVHVLGAQLVTAHTLQPLGSKTIRKFTVRRCDFAWSGDGMREATVGTSATFSATTSCADLAPNIELTVRFHGPSIFLANVTSVVAGQFLCQYTPMESGAHYLMIWVAYYHNSGLGEATGRLEWAARGTYTGGLLVPSSLNATPPVMLVLPNSGSTQPMRECDPRTEMGGIPTRFVLMQLSASSRARETQCPLR